MYRVIYPFADLQDEQHIYEVGDIYPRPHLAVTDARLSELATTNNKTGRPLIECIQDENASTISENSSISASDDNVEDSSVQNVEAEERAKMAVKRGRKKKVEE